MQITLNTKIALKEIPNVSSDGKAPNFLKSIALPGPSLPSDELDFQSLKLVQKYRDFIISET